MSCACLYVRWKSKMEERKRNGEGLERQRERRGEEGKRERRQGRGVEGVEDYNLTHAAL